MAFLFDTKEKKVNKTLALAHSHGCAVCTLNKIKTNMAPTGAIDPVIYICGEAPGELEIKKKRQFIGESGTILREAIYDIIQEDLDESIRWNNIVKCRPMTGNANRTPTDLEIQCCYQSTFDDIEKTKPYIVVGVGATPLGKFIGGVKVGGWRGRFLPIKIGTHVCWYYQIYHPSFLLRKGYMLDDEYTKVFIQDLYKLFKFINENKSPVFLDKEHKKNIHIYTDIASVEKGLLRIAKLPSMAIDIETRGIGKTKKIKLRPYNDGALIATVAVGTYDDVIAFPLEHPKGFVGVDRDRIKKILYDFLLNSNIKIAHNLKFELEWLFHYYNYDKKILFETEWGDTEGQAYTLDERTSKSDSLLSLDTLVRVNFGFNLKEISSHINKDNVLTNDMYDLLLYNGLDTKYTHLLYNTQTEKLEKEGLLDVYKRRIDTTITLTVAQAEGMEPNLEMLDKFSVDMKNKISNILKDIDKLPEVKKFVSEKGKAFNAGSADHLIAVFKDKKYPSIKGTEKGKDSTDDSVLNILATVHKSKLAKLVMDYRGISKLYSTYIMGTKNVIHTDGLVHTNFNQYFTSTGRLSSDGPNMQNYPSRETKEIRDIFKAPDGYAICAFDFGQIEARLIGVMSKDEVYCSQLWEDFDIHKHWALEIIEEAKRCGYKNEKFENIKAFRGDVKTNFVFASFYGALANTCAYRLDIPDNIITTVQKKFWETYSDAKIYIDNLTKFYNDNGYVETPLGIRRHAPMSINEYSNAPIQGGAAVDIVLASGDRLSKLSYYLKKPQYNYRINIHDDLTFMLPLDSLEEDILFIAKEMTRPAYDFITVPLAVELKIGDTWGKGMEEVETFKTTDFFDYNNGIWIEKI